MTDTILHLFAERWIDLEKDVHETAKDHGWWTDIESGKYDPSAFNKAEKIALMHSELSEAIEGLRKEKPSDHIPYFSSVEEELADVIIRIADFAAAYHYDVADAVVAKAEFNKTREYKHGGKKF